MSTSYLAKRKLSNNESEKMVVMRVTKPNSRSYITENSAFRV